MSPRLGKALTDVATSDLELLLARLYRGALELPITHPALLRAGLPHLVDRLGFLQGLGAEAVRAALVAAIAERRAAAARSAKTRPPA